MWQQLKKYWHKPKAIIPTELDLKRWASSEWIEYQAWLFHHGFLTLHAWQTLRNTVMTWQKCPLISIVTPIFNTDPAYLQECIYSVQTQAYPHWELCLVDDGSDNPQTISALQDLADIDDSRIHLYRLPNNQGICHATNQAISMAHGDYVAFLDHDDRLSPDALYHVVTTLQQFPDTDIIYSDRDTLSPDGLRFMHLFKPDWSPETLLSGNYLFHLVVYKKQLLEKLGGVRVGLAGSQDYDLILRAAETSPQVRHIPKVLYHWRQHKQSVAMAHNVKEYVYTTGMQALRDALTRRQLVGTVSENTTLWRGNYRVKLQALPEPVEGNYHLLSLTTFDNYAQQINTILQNPTIEYLIILADYIQPIDNEALTELIAWLQLNSVGIVTGKIIDSQQYLLHAGLVQRPNGVPLAIYAGFPEKTAGYMAVTASVRNVSTPHPACCVLKRSVWQQLGGLNPEYTSEYALFDFALRALQQGSRIVYTPFARFIAEESQMPKYTHEIDRQRFIEQWTTWLSQSDPYYNPHLTLELGDMGLEMRVSSKLTA